MKSQSTLTLALLILAPAALSQILPPPPPPPPPPQPLGSPVAPAGNPITAIKAQLGKALFWDEQLSSTRTVSCGTCHQFVAGGSDPRSFGAMAASFHPGLDQVFATPDDVVGSQGVPLSDLGGLYVAHATFDIQVQVTGRKSPSVLDAAYAPLLFWDGRASGTLSDPTTGGIVLPAGAALEAQALGPPVADSEMAHTGRDWQQVADRVAASRPLAVSPSVPAALESWIAGRSYAELFAEVFGSPGITPARIVMAIATYERTLVANQTPFDLELAGTPSLTAPERRGRDLFIGIGCASCHAGNRLTDDQFHYIGVRPTGEDLGRFAITANPMDRGAFRTPSLRNLQLRAPYMHNGRFRTLEEVVDFYDRGGDFMAPSKDARIRPLGLAPGQKADLLAFLRRPLVDPRVAAGAAPFDAPALYAASSLVPTIVPGSTSGASGSRPRAMAIEPPLAGNPSFTVAVHDGLGGARADLVIDTLPPGLTPPAAPTFHAESITLAGSGAGQGHGSVSLALPSDPAWIGVDLHGRWYVHDGGLAVSEVFRFRIFGSAASSAICGDCNGDGQVATIVDALSAAQHGVGILPITTLARARCDVDASAALDIIDALRIAQHAAGAGSALVCP